MRNADYHDHEYRTRVKWDAAHFAEVVVTGVVGPGVGNVGTVAMAMGRGRGRGRDATQEV